jgi:hypothetical protein
LNFTVKAACLLPQAASASAADSALSARFLSSLQRVLSCLYFVRPVKAVSARFDKFSGYPQPSDMPHKTNFHALISKQKNRQPSSSSR